MVSMSKQNRVTPFGELVAVEARGLWMGNRGCLHDDRQRIVRPFAGRRWIYCVLEFRGRRRRVMSPGQYTELFFLDEPTALAAGHRPCAECQHARYVEFRDAWARANLGPKRRALLKVEEMDLVMHGERVGADRAKPTWMARVADLPAGVMVADPAGTAWLVTDTALLRWEPSGYSLAIPKPGRGELAVLTPASVVRALAAGFTPVTHPSAARR
jgi:hypothetical protein